MTRRFPRPARPMGEAWFMGGRRRLFEDLFDDSGAISRPEVIQALENAASGTLNFGPLEEWTDWYHHLLPRLVPVAHEEHGFESIAGLLVTGFMALNLRGAPELPHYPEFMDDVLATLGRVPMSPGRWDGQEIVLGTILRRSPNRRTGLWGWGEVDGELSSILFLHLKYLPADQVREWLESALAIASAHWRAQILAWLVGAHRILTDPTVFPEDLEDSEWPRISWPWSFLLSRRSVAHAGLGTRFFCPPPNVSVAIETIRSHFTEATFCGWLDSIASSRSLEAELDDLPFRFWELYATR